MRRLESPELSPPKVLSYSIQAMLQFWALSSISRKILVPLGIELQASPLCSLLLYLGEPGDRASNSSEDCVQDAKEAPELCHSRAMMAVNWRAVHIYRVQFMSSFIACFLVFYSLLCPEFVQHLVDTGMLDGLPIYLRISVKTMNVRSNPRTTTAKSGVDGAQCSDMRYRENAASRSHMIKLMLK